MSWNPILDTHIPIGDAVDAIETVIVPRARDLGGFEVRRALPAPRRQMVGPFVRPISSMPSRPTCRNWRPRANACVLYWAMPGV